MGTRQDIYALNFYSQSLGLQQGGKQAIPAADVQNGAVGRQKPEQMADQNEHSPSMNVRMNKAEEIHGKQGPAEPLPLHDKSPRSSLLSQKYTLSCCDFLQRPARPQGS